MEPRVKLYMPKEESFPIPLKYHWSVDGDRELSDARTGFTRFILLNGRPLDGCTWSGSRLTRKQTTSRPDNVRPDMWKHMSDAAKRKEKQHWIIEKSKLDNARQLRGIFFIEPDDEEFKHTMKNARTKLEIPMPAAMPCKTSVNAAKKPAAALGNTRPNVLEKSKLTSPRDFDCKELLKKGIKQRMQRQQWKNFEKLEKIPAWQLTRVRNKKEVIDEAGHEGKTVHFASLMDLCHLKNSELEPNFQKYKGRVVLRGDTVKYDSGSYAVFSEQGSLASQMTAA